MKILIVEDRYDDRYLLETLLNYVQYEYVWAENGLEALKTLQVEPIGLIISDILMMGMDGYELCYKIKQDDRLRHIPFVFLTATYLTGADEKFALSLGADRFVRKPVNQDHLYAIIAELMDLVKTDQYCPKPPLQNDRFDQDHLQQMMSSMEKKTLELEHLFNKQKKMEQDLRESEHRYRVISSQTSDYFYQAIRVDENQMKITWLSGAIEEITGYKKNEFKNYNDFLNIVVEADHPKFMRHIETCASSENSLCGYRIQTKQGKEKWIEDSYQVVRDKDNPDRITGIIGAVKDITQKKHYEEELSMLATVVDSAVESIVITDTSGTIEYVNPAFEKISGYAKADVLGENPRLFKSGHQDAGFYQTLWQTISQGRTWKGTFVNKKKDGTRYDAGGTIQPVMDPEGRIMHYAAVQRDITHERYLESRLRQSQKMESIGILAGGIAHDFNNILSPIIGFTQLNIDLAAKDSCLKKDLNEILTAANRAKQLVRQILTFARKTESEFYPIKVSLVIKEALGLLTASLPATIALKHNIESRARIMGDSSQIHQVVMNLVTNALHAIGSSTGEIMISLKDRVVDQNFVERYPELKTGNHVLLEVQDTGCGISQETLACIFDPFFTTKETDQGTGLGLSTVYGIVKSHSGIIQVESQPGQGSVFKIILPVYSEEAALDDGDHGDGAHGELPGGKESILFVDDEKAIVRMFEIILKKLGYTVTAMDSSLNALEKFKSDPHAFDLVISDMSMPKMLGIDLARELVAIRPDIPIIICSGYSSGFDKENLSSLGIKAILTKPVSRIELANVIQQVLPQ